MKKKVYKFADGTVSEVEISDEVYAVMEKLDKAEKSTERRETRRHVSLESLAEKSIEPPVTDKYDFTDDFQNIKNAELYSAIKSLSKEQKELIHKVFYERKRLKEIAKDEKVSTQIISWRLRTTLSQLRINR